ncbi:MAG: DUF4173 domain-containing protein [Planctomycetia bacterium]|nr:DUF4173 domain-containing protein [Planctomycetia bacterium]
MFAVFLLFLTIIIGYAILGILGLLYRVVNREPSGVVDILPVRWREMAAVVLGIVAVDFCLYQGALESMRLPCPIFPPAGKAAFLAGMPLVFWLGCRCRPNGTTLLLTLLTWAAAGKVLYCGSLQAFFCGMVLLGLLVMAGTGAKFTLRSLLWFVDSGVRKTPRRIADYFVRFRKNREAHVSTTGCSAVLIPLMAVLVFGSLFVAANPTLRETLSNLLAKIRLDERYLPKFTQVLCWGMSGATLVGLLLPRVWKTPEAVPEQELEPCPSPWYAVSRNTLWAVVGVFALEIVYEIGSMIYWDPPVDFCYGTYCHQGAAWLTFALFLATVVLEMIFRPAVYRDVRIRGLWTPALLWTLLCVALGGVIYWRLGVYIAQTGMTTLRVVGLFGTTAVVVGLFWMYLKIRLRRRFVWLLRKYVGTVAALFFLYSVLPIQACIWKYNTTQIMAGNYGPVQHLVHQTIPPEGLLQIFPLLGHPEPAISNGAAALLAMSRDLFWGDHPSSYLPYHVSNWREWDYVDAHFTSHRDFNHAELQPFFSDEKWFGAIAAMRHFSEKHVHP